MDIVNRMLENVPDKRTSNTRDKRIFDRTIEQFLFYPWPPILTWAVGGHCDSSSRICSGSANNFIRSCNDAAKQESEKNKKPKSVSLGEVMTVIQARVIPSVRSGIPSLAQSIVSITDVGNSGRLLFSSTIVTAIIRHLCDALQWRNFLEVLASLEIRAGLELVFPLPKGHDLRYEPSTFPRESRQEAAPTTNLTPPEYPVTPVAVQRSLKD
ncbi:hypothetical protein J6590_029890 [Homalodisca vitripennis]|nr:hypothetical protein J6590_029890 [Homalodisca vitripennis]